LLARDDLYKEGITNVTYVSTNFTTRQWLTDDLADVALAHPEFMVATLNAGVPLTILAGLHTACLELWVDRSITSFSGLRGRRISVRVADLTDQFYAFFATILAWIGIDPLRDVHFVEAGLDNYPGMINAFKQGRADAVLAGGVEGPRLRQIKPLPGHVLLDTMIAKPWSQYECCHLVANRDWALRNPAATQRVTRAIIRATDRAAKDHPRAAHDAVASGNAGTSGYFQDETLVTQAMDMCTYNWRTAEPEETLRFFSLRLAEANLIKRTPEELIGLGANFAYMRQLRSEL